MTLHKTSKQKIVAEATSRIKQKEEIAAQRKEQFPVQQKEWLSPIDLELEFGIARGTQGNLRSQGLIPYHKRGNIVKYKRSDINEWFEDGKVV